MRMTRDIHLCAKLIGVESVSAREAQTYMPTEHSFTNIPNSLVGLVDSKVGMKKNSSSHATHDATNNDSHPGNGMSRLKVRLSQRILVIVDCIKTA